MRRALRQCLRPRQRRLLTELNPTTPKTRQPKFLPQSVSTHLTELNPTNPKTRQPKFYRNLCLHSGILKLLYTLNDRVGQLEDRDCSGTSAPLQSYHAENDDSQSDSANRTEQEAGPAKSASDFPKFDLCEELELDDDEDV